MPNKQKSKGHSYTEMENLNAPSGSLANPLLLQKIDKLFACGVGDYIALPQLVVVGDQSSGKSSVLEGLTNLPFPRDSGLCTRFATQITFRRAQETNISVSIIPSKDASQEHIATTQAWVKNDLKALDAQTFSGIMIEVHKLMGLGDQRAAGGKGTFSDDVLRLEITGPEQEHFSVVDVPGIFRKTTEGVTTKTDRDMVNAMVRRYMENPRSVMLTVIAANVDIATQEIMTMAEEVDEDGHRTLGVLTKPDLVDGGAEMPVIELIEGKRHKLSLGWCLVRNPGQKELNNPANDRNAVEEAFFQTKAPWNSLDKDKVGVGALRVRLQEILAAHIRREFPKVRAEIHKRLADSKSALNSLGPQRETREQQSKYLTEISVKFQDTTALALNAHYMGSNWFDDCTSLRFATAVTERNELFAGTMEQYGHTYEFEAVEPDQTLEMAMAESATVDVAKEVNDLISCRTTTNNVELDEVTIANEEISTKTCHDTMKWLTTVYWSSRGFELGTFDSSLIAITMKTQSARWEGLALGYISDVISMAHTFITDLLQLICPDVRVRDGLMSVMMEELMAKYKGALDNVRFLLHVERMGRPTTLNPGFHRNLEESRQDRTQNTLKGKSLDNCKHGSVVRLNDIVQERSMSTVESIVRSIHDIFESYYKIARERFVDNVWMQAASYHLVTGPDTPLKLLSPSFIAGLTTEQLEDIAGEDVGLKRKRKTLNKEIKGLEAGRKILN